MSEKTYRTLAGAVLACTLVWYLSVLVTGTSQPSQTWATVLGLTLLFLLSTLLFVLGESRRMAGISFFLALFGALILFLLAGWIGSFEGRY